MDSFENLLQELVVEFEAKERNQSKQEIGKISLYSDSITDKISSVLELNVYTSLELQETMVDRLSLIIKINLDYIDEKTGLTNLEKMSKGEPPIDPKTKSVVHLHHIGQEFDAPFAEIPAVVHQNPHTYGILHTKNKSSWRNDKNKEAKFRKQRKSHWIKRSYQISGKQ